MDVFFFFFFTPLLSTLNASFTGWYLLAGSWCVGCAAGASAIECLKTAGQDDNVGHVHADVPLSVTMQGAEMNHGP